VLVCAVLGIITTYIPAGMLSLAFDLLRAWKHLGVVYTLPSAPAPTPTIEERLHSWYRQVQPVWHCLGPREYGLGMVAPDVTLALISLALMPLTFLLLPLTFRRLHVRRLHLLRIAAYGWMWVPLLLWVGMAVAEPTPSGPWWLPRPFTVRPIDIRWRYIGTVLIAWQVWWWWAAARLYLKLPRALIVSLVLTALSCVAAFAILFAWYGGGALLYRL
jgi:hypothetical protein